MRFVGEEGTGAYSHLGEGMELGGRVCYFVKVLHIRHNLFLEPKLYLSLIMSQSQHTFCLGRGLSPNLGKGWSCGVECGSP